MLCGSDPGKGSRPQPHRIVRGLIVHIGLRPATDLIRVCRSQESRHAESAHFTGIVLTKLDGTAKGGIVLAIAHDLNLPVVYAGTGEKLEDLIPLKPEGFIDSLLD